MFRQHMSNYVFYLKIKKSWRRSGHWWTFEERGASLLETQNTVCYKNELAKIQYIIHTQNTQFYKFLTKISLMKEKWLSSTPNGLDLMSWNAVLECDDENAAEHWLEVLKRMEKLHKGENKSSVRPDVFSYTTVINALSRSKKLSMHYHVEKNLFPNTVTINAVISAHAKSKEKVWCKRCSWKSRKAIG